MDLLHSQAASGSFEFTAKRLEELFDGVGVSYHDWRVTLWANLQPPAQDEERLLITLLVVVLLDLAARDVEDLWRRAVQKSLRFAASAMEQTAEDLQQSIAGLINADGASP